MARLRFTPGTRYVLEGAVYLVRQALPQERVVIENHTSGGQLVVPLDDLVVVWTTDWLEFKVGRLRARERDGQSVPTTSPVTDLEALAPEQRAEAWCRYALLQPLLALSAAERTRAALARYAASTGADGVSRVSRASLERWLRAFLASGQDIRALVPARYRSGARGQGRLGAETEALVSEVLASCAAAPRYRTTGDVYLLVLHRIAEVNKERPAAERLCPPSPRTIQRRIVQAGAPAILRRVSRADQQATRPVGAGPAPVRILERVEIDHTVLDVILVDATDRRPIGRPTPPCRVSPDLRPMARPAPCTRSATRYSTLKRGHWVLPARAAV